MERKILIDTHVALWLTEGAQERFSERAKKLLRSLEINISPISLLELSLLFEIKRIKLTAEEIIHILKETIGLKIIDDSFEAISKAAISISWTRDPFDRLIVTQAKVKNLQLITKDQHILKHYKKAVW